MRNMNVQKIVNSVVRLLRKFNSAIPATFTAPLVLALPSSKGTGLNRGLSAFRQAPLR